MKPKLKVVKPNFSGKSRIVRETLCEARKARLQSVIVLGFNQNDEAHLFGGGLVNKDALWLLEWAKKQTLP